MSRVLRRWVTTHGDTVELFAGGQLSRRRHRFRYRVRARNGRVVETGSEGYVELHAAFEAATRHHPIVEEVPVA